MFNYISFSHKGTKNLDILRKADLNIIDLKDSRYASILASLLGVNIYPRVKEVKKGFLSNKIDRDVYSGYLSLNKKTRSGDIVTCNEKVCEGLELNKVEISIELFQESKIVVSNKETEDRLTKAKLVFLAGRGVGNKETYLKIKELARKVGAEVGCTRPVCMNGFESFDNFVGISGKSLNADLCITFGVSGSGPLIKGLENVKKIISINNDKNALVFNYSDYKIVEDLNIVLKEMESELK